MSDKMHQEIEEILARLDREVPNRPGSPAVGVPDSERAPISFEKKRRERRNPITRLRRSASGVTLPVTPTALLFTGAGMMVVGLAASSFAQPFIWLSLAGVFLFLAAFAWSFFRTAAPSAGPSPKAVYWRDRYIEYEPANPGPFARLKRRFRR